MTVTAHQLFVYALGMAALWVVPGPVWVAVLARSLAGGFAAAWPLAVGVAIGDAFWPLAAITGLSWITGVWSNFLEVLGWAAAGIFLFMGFMLIRKPAGDITANSRLTRPGIWAGLAVGLATVIGNPKAMLFYMGALPGFFTLETLTAADILAILLISMAIPMIGNIVLALSLDRARRLLESPEAMRRMNVISGLLLIAVGLAIPFL